MYSSIIHHYICMHADYMLSKVITGLTLETADEWTWCSCHSPGSVRGNLTALTAPELVPANSIRPE